MHETVEVLLHSICLFYFPRGPCKKTNLGLLGYSSLVILAGSLLFMQSQATGWCAEVCWGFPSKKKKKQQNKKQASKLDAVFFTRKKFTRK